MSIASITIFRIRKETLSLSEFPKAMQLRVELGLKSRLFGSQSPQPYKLYSLILQSL